MSSTNRGALVTALTVSIIFILGSSAVGQHTAPVKVVAFYTAKRDQAHITYVHEANKWFPRMTAKYNFTYDSTDNWDNLNSEFLSRYEVVLFLDTRPEKPEQRMAFQKYMEQGGGWIGFHFAGFALNNSDYPQNWDWYHDVFLGCGEYASNTWRPTAAILKVEDQQDPMTQKLPRSFKTSPSEWYRWSKDLRANPDIKILLSVDPSSFPLGTKADETWHSGYYPIAWTNKKYNMIYTNWGHNDIDYENKTNEQLSFTFGNPVQDEWIIESILLIGNKSKSVKK
ncbi:MAG TPA: ThuA domain-containing protein [Chryseolinea sp.]